MPKWSQYGFKASVWLCGKATERMSLITNKYQITTPKSIITADMPVAAKIQCVTRVTSKQGIFAQHLPAAREKLFRMFKVHARQLCAFNQIQMAAHLGKQIITLYTLH